MDDRKTFGDLPPFILMEFLMKLSSVFLKVGGIADREALVEMKVATVFERDFSAGAHVDREQKAASFKSFFLILVFSLFLLFFLGFMIAIRSNRRAIGNGNADVDQPDEEQQMIIASTTADPIVVNQRNNRFEIETNQARRSRHCICLYTLEAKCNFGTRLAFLNFILEIPPAVLDQIAPDEKPTYVLIMMIFSFTSVLLCLVELVYKGKRQKITWKWRWGSGRLPWFYHPPPSDKPFGTFIEIIGLICAIAQSIVTTINYCVCIRNHASPIKIQVWPSIFAFGLLCSKLAGKPYDEDGESRAPSQDVGDVALLNHPVLEPFMPPELQQ